MLEFDDLSSVHESSSRYLERHKYTSSYQNCTLLTRLNFRWGGLQSLAADGASRRRAGTRVTRVPAVLFGGTQPALARGGPSATCHPPSSCGRPRPRPQVAGAPVVRRRPSCHLLWGGRRGRRLPPSLALPNAPGAVAVGGPPPHLPPPPLPSFPRSIVMAATTGADGTPCHPPLRAGRPGRAIHPPPVAAGPCLWPRGVRWGGAPIRPPPPPPPSLLGLS